MFAILFAIDFKVTNSWRIFVIKINKMSVKLAIFDLDGTLINTIGDLGSSCNAVLAAHGFPTHPMEDYKIYIGRGMRNLIRQAMPPEVLTEALLDQCFEEYKQQYLRHIYDFSYDYQGMNSLLEGLTKAGIKTVVASNKIQEGTDRLINHFFPDIPFVAIMGFGPDRPLKPNTAMVEEAMTKAGASREETVLIGDSMMDLQTAANAAIRFIAVSWGFRPLSDASYATFTAASPQAILEYCVE